MKLTFTEARLAGLAIIIEIEHMQKIQQYDLDTLKQGESVGEGTSYDLPKYDITSLKKDDANNKSGNKDNDLSSLDDETSKDITEFSNSNNDPQSQKLDLREDQKQRLKDEELDMGIGVAMKSNNDDHKTSSYTTKIDEELPQTGEKDDLIGTILTAFSTMFAVLGISFFRRKDDLKKRR